MALLYIFPNLFYISGLMGDCWTLLSASAVHLLWRVVLVQTCVESGLTQAGSWKREEHFNSLFK